MPSVTVASDGRTPRSSGLSRLYSRSSSGSYGHIPCARTTELGLKALSELKYRLGVGWDALVIDAVCAHYELDRAAMSLPPRAKKDTEPKAGAGTREAKKRTAGEKAGGAAEPEGASR